MPSCAQVGEKSSSKNRASVTLYLGMRSAVFNPPAKLSPILCVGLALVVSCSSSLGDAEGTEPSQDSGTESDARQGFIERGPGWNCNGASTPDGCTSECGDGIQVGDERCDDGNREAGDGCSPICQVEGEECVFGETCTYDYTAWSDWGECPVDSLVRARTRECRRSDGLLVDCVLCGGECIETGDCCKKFNLSLVHCAPAPPGDQTMCNATLNQKAEECRANDCSWSGPSVCEIGGAQTTTTCYGAEGTCSPIENPF